MYDQYCHQVDHKTKLNLTFFSSYRNNFLKLYVTIINHPLKTPMQVCILKSPVSPTECCSTENINLGLAKSLEVFFRSILNSPIRNPFALNSKLIHFSKVNFYLPDTKLLTHSYRELN